MNDRAMIASLWAAVAALAAVPACGGSVCVPGATQACVCPPTAAGAQTCADDGSHWLQCVCAPVGAPAGAPPPSTTAEAPTPATSASSLVGLAPGVYLSGSSAPVPIPGYDAQVSTASSRATRTVAYPQTPASLTVAQLPSCDPRPSGCRVSIVTMPNVDTTRLFWAAAATIPAQTGSFPHPAHLGATLALDYAAHPISVRREADGIFTADIPAHGRPESLVLVARGAGESGRLWLFNLVYPSPGGH